MIIEIIQSPIGSSQPLAEAMRAKMTAPLKKPATRPSRETIIQMCLLTNHPTRSARSSPPITMQIKPIVESDQPKESPIIKNTAKINAPMRVDVT